MKRMGAVLACPTLGLGVPLSDTASGVRPGESSLERQLPRRHAQAYDGNETEAVLVGGHMSYIVDEELVDDHVSYVVDGEVDEEESAALREYHWLCSRPSLVRPCSASRPSLPARSPRLTFSA